MLIRCSDICKISFFLTRNHNGFEDEVPIYYYILNQLNIVSNVLSVTDAKDRQMTTNYYDMTGQLIYTYNIDSGRRWMIYDIANKPLRLWDNRNNELQYEYDALQRPTKTKLKENGSSTAITTESIVYGTSATNYRKGKPEFIYDQSGKTNYSVFDFKGNPLTIIKQYTEAYDETIDWNSSPAPTLETETFTTVFEYDAMNRPTGQTKPDATVEEYTYNKAGLLETISAQLRGDSNWTDFITNINYNEKGQRTQIYFDNGSRTEYAYDTNTFRLINIYTTRNSGSDVLQDIDFTYDPVGNIVQQTDNALQTFYYNNSVVDPTGLYVYDPLYRLIQAEGRELTGLAMSGVDDFINTIAVPNSNTNAMQTYDQRYEYDALGNITQMRSVDDWTRNYFYETENNQLIGHVDEQTDYTLRILPTFRQSNSLIRE